MTRLPARLYAYVTSLTGRMALVLALGMSVSTIAGLLVAEQARVRDFRLASFGRVVDSTADIARRLDAAPADTVQRLREDEILGARLAEDGWRMTDPLPDLSRMLQSRLGSASQAQAMAMPREACFPNLDLRIRAAGMTNSLLPDCWFVTFVDKRGVMRRLSVDLMPLKIPRNKIIDPIYLAMIVFASGVLSLLVAKLATAPLRRLTKAARAFSLTADVEPIPESGPGEVRLALETFNLMQKRVRGGFLERTQILASVTHDLQTPLTRLRLRLEQVSDPELRDQLVADLAVMQNLVQDGLDFAQSNEVSEPWSMVDISSVLSSLAEDALDAGKSVRFAGAGRLEARVRPGALVRCINNLIDNAVKYAGSAELFCCQEGDGIVVQVADRGTGIPEGQIETAFAPFKRLSDKTPGTGLGLAIARTQAETFGATVRLFNREGGGLVAEIRLAAQ